MATKNFVSITEAAERIDESPKRICNALWLKWFDPDRCVLAGGRRFFREEDLEELRQVMHKHSRKPAGAQS